MDLKIFETKDFTGVVNDVDVKGRVVTGYLSVFGNIDRHSDIIEPGAFKKSISERRNDIYFLNQHDWKQPHGKFSVLKEDEYGLYFESEPLIDTTYSNDVLKLYEAGIIEQHSIGFIPIQKHIKSSVRHLTELQLFEGSNVTIGANDKTRFLGTKTNIKQINEKTTQLIKAIRNGNFTDDTFMLMEIAVKQLQSDAFEYGKTLNQKGIEPSTVDTRAKDLADYINNFTKNQLS